MPPKVSQRQKVPTPAELPDWVDQEAVAKFLADIQGEDLLAVIVRGHLYVESVLTQMIEEFLAEPKAIDVERLSFRLKVELALAVGAPIGDLSRPLAELNSLRNKLAHNVEATITASDQDRLFKSFTRPDRSAIVGQSLYDSISFLHGYLTGHLHHAREAKKTQR